MTDGRGPYRVMPRPVVTDGVILLRAVDPSDVEAIRQWRNAQMDVLRQTQPITRDAQRHYFEANVWPTKARLDPAQILLVIEQAGELIGYGGLVHISWLDRRAEISFLLAADVEKDENRRRNLFACFLGLVCEIAFHDLNITRLYTETYAHRIAHITALERAGFVLEGRLRSHVIVDGQAVDSLFHGLLGDEWETRT